MTWPLTTDDLTNDLWWLDHWPHYCVAGDETFNEVFRDFTNMAYNSPEKLNRNKWPRRSRTWSVGPSVTDVVGRSVTDVVGRSVGHGRGRSVSHGRGRSVGHRRGRSVTDAVGRSRTRSAGLGRGLWVVRKSRTWSVSQTWSVGHGHGLSITNMVCQSRTWSTGYRCCGLPVNNDGLPITIVVYCPLSLADVVCWSRDQAHMLPWTLEGQNQQLSNLAFGYSLIAMFSVSSQPRIDWQKSAFRLMLVTIYCYNIQLV